MNKKKIYPQWFLILPLALYIIFFLLPSIMGVAYSFTDWNSRSVLNGVHFVELDNFKEIFTSNKDYLSGIGNTLKFTIISNIVKLIPALLIAIMLQEGLKGKGLYRTLLYLPSILPFVIIGLVFKSILNYNNGLLNAILDGLHLGILKQKWLSDLGVVWKSIYGVDAWRGIGYVMTIFLAGLNTIPRSYYEAAEIDGANFWQRLRYVTLPMLSGAIMINLVFGITYGLKVFDIVYMMIEKTNPAIRSCETILYNFYQETFVKNNKGYGSALVVWCVILIAIITAVQFIGQKKWVTYDV